MSEFLILVAETIRHARKLRNLSQEELAFLSGLDRSYISGVERGNRNLTINSLARIIEAMDIPLKEFLDIMSASAEKFDGDK